MIIRKEVPQDIVFIRKINEEAFEQPNEANLVDALRESGSILSLVAETSSGDLVGHILFSRAPIVNSDGSEFPAVSLAPMAVLKQYQSKGIGGRLIKEGLILLQQMDEMVVVVLGHPWYYPKFGFEPAEQYGIHPPFEVGNPNAWMVYYIERDLINQVEGTVRYPDAFLGV